MNDYTPKGFPVPEDAAPTPYCIDGEGRIPFRVGPDCGACLDYTEKGCEYNPNGWDAWKYDSQVPDLRAEKPTDQGLDYELNSFVKLHRALGYSDTWIDQGIKEMLRAEGFRVI